MSHPFDKLIDSYLDTTIGIDTGFITQGLSDGLQQNIRQLRDDNRMNPAGIGNDRIKDTTQQLRGDSICWMDKTTGNSFEKEFLQLAEDFIAHLNMTCYTGINSYEFHYALYEEGSFYKRHKDQFRNDSQRKYSLVNYLNEDWTEENGGHLVVYPGSGMQKIQPHSRTAVFFKSAELEHEVVTANRQRMSITGWLKQV
jgi:SM-20-related protein